MYGVRDLDLRILLCARLGRDSRGTNEFSPLLAVLIIFDFAFSFE
jgi:hypothetical protein